MLRLSVLAVSKQTNSHTKRCAEGDAKSELICGGTDSSADSDANGDPNSELHEASRWLMTRTLRESCSFWLSNLLPMIDEFGSGPCGEAVTFETDQYDLAGRAQVTSSILP
jgi:hypothetical protein